MRPPRVQPTRQLAVIAALTVLLLCGSSTALATSGPDVTPQSTTTTFVLGPLGILADPTDSEPFSSSARGDDQRVSLGLRDEEIAIINLVRDAMSPEDQATLDRLLAEVTAQESRLDDARLELESIMAEVGVIADEYLLAPTWLTPTLGGVTRPKSVLFKVKDDWVFPVQGPHRFSDTFGAPRYSGGYHPHQGADIFCERYTPLVAVIDGVIVRANPFDTGLGGKTVSFRGVDGHRYYYAHLSSLEKGIRPGVRVAAGQVVGYAGNTGNARYSAVHLHFEIHPWGGAAIDPYPILVGARTVADMTGPTPTTTTTTTTMVPDVPVTTGTTDAQPDLTTPDSTITTITDGTTSTTQPPTATATATAPPATTTTAAPPTTTTSPSG